MESSAGVQFSIADPPADRAAQVALAQEWAVDQGNLLVPGVPCIPRAPRPADPAVQGSVQVLARDQALVRDQDLDSVQDQVVPDSPHRLPVRHRAQHVRVREDAVGPATRRPKKVR